MSLRFAIRNTQSKAEVEGSGTIVRYSGASEPFRRSSERSNRTIKVNEKREPIEWKFTTGLNPEQVKFYDWYSDKEKEVIVEKIKELSPLIEAFYGGSEVIDPKNYSFWKEDRNINRLSLTNSDIDTFFDTKFPAHALLFLSIVSGAFIDLIAPTKEWAQSHEVLHYMILESEADTNDDDNDDIIRSDAHAALVDLRKNADTDALFILAWCTQYDTKTFRAYTKATPMRELINYHIQFIDGKFQSKKKTHNSKSFPKIFLEYYEKWKGQQTKPLLYAEAYVKAGEYFNLFHSADKKYTTGDNNPLGNSIDEAAKNLIKNKFNDDLQKLKDQVEVKWTE